MADDRIEIEIVLDDGSIKKGFASISDASKKVGTELETNLNKSFSILKSGAGLLAGALGAAVAGFTLKKAVSEAIDGENALARLNNSLKLAGTFSEESSLSFEKFASDLQKVTILSDNTVLSLSALARNFTHTNEQAKELTKAAIDLSAATGRSLEESIDSLGKTFSGTAGRLSQFIPQLRNLTTEQLRSGEALRIINDRFGGSAAAQALTFGGAVDKLHNSFDEILKSFGKVITSSPTLIKVLGDITKVFFGFSETINGSTSGTDFFKPIIIGAISLGQAFVQVFGGIFDLVSKFGIIIVSSFTGTFNDVVAVAAGAAGSLISLFSPNSDLAKSLGATFDEAAAKSKESFATIDEVLNSSALGVDSPFLNNIFDKLTALGDKYSETAGVIKQKNSEIATSIDVVQQPIDNIFTNIKKGFTLFDDTLASSADQNAANAKRITTDFKAIGNSARDTFGRSIGSAFAEFGKALAKGENALSAFTKAFIASIAQGAIALGTEFILRGIAYSFVPGLQSLGPPLIAAGAALAAFGGALSAVSGGGGASAGAGGGSGGGGGGASGNPVTTADNATLTQEKTTQVKIDVQGTVLDPISVGQQIAGILSDTFNATGTKVVTA